VRDGNAFAAILAEMVRVAFLLGIFFVIEQPKSSLMFNHPLLKSALEATGAIKIYVEMWVWGGRSTKGMFLYGTAPWLRELRAHYKVLRQTNAHMLENLEKLTTTDSRGKVTGRKQELTESAAYPSAFGRCIGRMHAETWGHMAEADNAQ